MNVGQTVYFMSLVGGLAGLCCWFLSVLVSDQNLPLPQWIQDAVSTTIMGAMIGGMTVGFADRWTADRVVARWLLIGLLLGAGAGIATGALLVPLQQHVFSRPELAATPVPRLAGWTLAGGLIGLVTGLRWSSVNPLRAVHATIGGLAGGVLGGAVYSTLAWRDPFFAALAYVLTGTGITLGVTLAPVLLRDGVLRFVSSGDPAAQRKYASPRQEWVVQRGDRFLIGNQSADMSMTMYTRDVQIFIPDTAIAQRHAYLFEQNHAFYIQQHPDNASPDARSNALLQVDGEDVLGTRQLRDGDELLIGQTILRFSMNKKRTREAPVAGDARG